MSIHGNYPDGSPFVRCDEGDRLYTDWERWKSERGRTAVTEMLRLADMDEAWDEYQAHVKVCGICTERRKENGL